MTKEILDIFMKNTVTILIGVFSSLVASILFLLFISRIRPNIEISSSIANIPVPEAHKSLEYNIKVINRNKRPVINVRAELCLVTIKQIPNGSLYVTTDIKLKRNNIFEIAAFNKKAKAAEYAFRFTTFENLDKIWKNDTKSFIRFRIYATDALTGFGRVFTHDYRVKRLAIKHGEFYSGNSFKIA